MEILSTLLNIAVLVYAGSSMLSVGIGHALRQIIGPLRNTRAVIRAVEIEKRGQASFLSVILKLYCQ